MSALTRQSVPTSRILREQGLGMMDRITARVVGDYITLNRSAWLDLADELREDSELFARIVTNIAWRPADES